MNQNEVRVYFRKGIHQDDNLPLPVVDSGYAALILIQSLFRSITVKGYRYYGFAHVEIWLPPALAPFIADLLYKAGELKGVRQFVADSEKGMFIGSRGDGVTIQPYRRIIKNPDHWVTLKWDVTDTRFPCFYTGIEEFARSCVADQLTFTSYPTDDILAQHGAGLYHYDNVMKYCSEYLMYKVGLCDSEDNKNPDEAYRKMRSLLNTKKVVPVQQELPLTFF